MASDHPREPILDGDNPEWTDADFAQARPAADVLPPAVLAAFPRTRGPQKAPTKTQVTLRVESTTLARIRATGRGWQTRINDILTREFGK